jgi:hypothetical protein
MHVLQRHVLRPNPSIQTGHKRMNSDLAMSAASHVLTIDSEQQTSIWQFN